MMNNILPFSVGCCIAREPVWEKFQQLRVDISPPLTTRRPCSPEQHVDLSIHHEGLSDLVTVIPSFPWHKMAHAAPFPSDLLKGKHKDKPNADRNRSTALKHSQRTDSA